MSAVLWAAVFFETSRDDECDPDLAVKQLEQIAGELGALPAEDQETFRAFARRAGESDFRPGMANVIAEVVDGLLGEPDGHRRTD